MRRAVAYHRNSQTCGAARIGSDLEPSPMIPITKSYMPRFCLKNRRYEAAINAYEKAMEMSPDAGLILAGYGRALLAPIRPRAMPRRCAFWKWPLPAKGLQQPPDARSGHGLCARWPRWHAAWATAERAALEGDFDTAALHARRATGLLPQGSSGWLRAQDVLRLSETQNK